MKKISFLFAFLCASVISFAQESVVASCDFTKKSASHSNYNDTWTYGDWSVYGAANSNGSWAYAKFGGKQTTLANANPCYIFGQVNQPVTKIVVTTNSGNLKAGSVNEWGVKVYSDAQKKNMIANVKGGTMTKSKSEALELIPTADVPWTSKSYYQVYFDLANTSTTNGIVWIDKIEFYAAPTENVPATAISIDKTALSIENYKNTVALTATVTPDNATDEIVWTSANEEIATISKMGVITALKEGTVTLTATAGSVNATCELTVTAPTVLTCAQAVEIAKAVSANNVKAENGKYVVRGYMTKEAGKGFASDMEKYKNISFWMADERGTAQTFEAYQVKPLDAANLPEVGALVEIVGDLTKYGTTYETTGGGSATMRVIENAPLQYELNGGVLASTPAPATTNLELWEVFKPAYNKYYNLQRADQPIDKVTTFAPKLMQDFMTNEASDWKWLGDYVLSVATAQGYTVNDESSWRWTMHAFFNCSPAASLTIKVAGFDEAGKPEKWIAAWDATHSTTLPERPTEATELPIPTREGYIFAGWYNNAEFTGEAITTVDANTKGTLYAKWLVPATAIKMSEIGLDMTVGETFTLTVITTPEGASLEGLTWTSSDEKLATVKDGV
ncbi:MAG: Ig-like domain-containing protein, partial [Bacteroidales bacterium]|nr:Ig-like domain-containing protein [Bacteroidales bacterium]